MYASLDRTNLKRETYKKDIMYGRHKAAIISVLGIEQEGSSDWLIHCMFCCVHK